LRETASRIGVHGHFLVEEAVAVAAVRFAPVQREVCLLHQRVRVDALCRRHRDADAGADAHRVAVDLVGRVDEGDDPFRELDRGNPLVGLAGLNDREFVAAEPRHHVGFP
jgi:hypothetical protein